MAFVAQCKKLPQGTQLTSVRELEVWGVPRGNLRISHLFGESGLLPRLERLVADSSLYEVLLACGNPLSTLRKLRILYLLSEDPFLWGKVNQRMLCEMYPRLESLQHFRYPDKCPLCVVAAAVDKLLGLPLKCLSLHVPTRQVSPLKVLLYPVLALFATTLTELHMHTDVQENISPLHIIKDLVGLLPQMSYLSITHPFISYTCKGDFEPVCRYVFMRPASLTTVVLNTTLNATPGTFLTVSNKDGINAVVFYPRQSQRYPPTEASSFFEFGSCHVDLFGVTTLYFPYSFGSTPKSYVCKEESFHRMLVLEIKDNIKARCFREFPAIPRGRIKVKIVTRAIRKTMRSYTLFGGQYADWAYKKYHVKAKCDWITSILLPDSYNPNKLFGKCLTWHRTMNIV